MPRLPSSAAVAAVAGAALRVVAVALVAMVVPAGAAVAHSGLVSVDPADGSTVGTAPSQVRLVFDEDVRSPASVVVAGPGGQRVQHGEPRVRAAVVVVPVRVTAQGRYTIGYRVVSADGHPVTGQTTFRYAAGESAAGTATAEPGHGGSGQHAEGAGAGSGGLSGTRVLGIVAVAVLLAGLALLTVRRLPGGQVHPHRDGGP